MSPNPLSGHALSIEQSLGRVEGVLASMEKNLLVLTTAIEADRAQAAAVREGINAALSTVTANVTSLRTDMNNVKPAVEALEKYHLDQRAHQRGALAAVGIMAGVVGTVFGYFKERIIQALWGA